MNRLITCAILIISIQSIGFCQKFTLGVEGGPNISSLRGENTNEDLLDPKIFYSVGIYSDYLAYNNFSLKLGAYYQIKGAKSDILFTDNTGTEIGTFELREVFKYISVPLLVKYQFGKKILFYINGGPTISFLMKQNMEFDSPKQFPLDNIDRTEYYKSTDFALSFGVGSYVPLTNKFNISIDLRNDLGLTDVSDNSNVTGYKLKNNSLNMMIGVNYKLIKKTKTTTSN